MPGNRLQSPPAITTTAAPPPSNAIINSRSVSRPLRDRASPGRSRRRLPSTMTGMVYTRIFTGPRAVSSRASTWSVPSARPRWRPLPGEPIPVHAEPTEVSPSASMYLTVAPCARSVSSSGLVSGRLFPAEASHRCADGGGGKRRAHPERVVERVLETPGDREVDKAGHD